MNPLQKKCVYATAGGHLLLVLILILGPGFFRRQPPATELQALKIIPIGAVEDALTRGTAQNPPPAAVVPPVTAPEPTKPVVETPKPVELPKPVEPVVKPKPAEPDTPDDVTPGPTPVPVKPKPRKIDLDFSHPVEHQVNSKPDTSAEDEHQAQLDAKKAAKQRATAADRILHSLDKGLSSSTEVDVMGNSSVATVNYGQLVQSIYDKYYVAPDNAGVNAASPKVHVVIGRDGTVISARITEPSGNRAVDESVRRVLDRVTMIQPFSPNAKEDQREYNITFDLTTQ
jgi:colicin import membrane protein